MAVYIHVIPRNDLLDHEYVDCPCGPDVKYVDDDDDGAMLDVPTVIHHSLDNREASER